MSMIGLRRGVGIEHCLCNFSACDMMRPRLGIFLKRRLKSVHTCPAVETQRAD